MENPEQKPCLVQTPQGFSISYQNKLLYSKYSPQRSILGVIEKLKLLPGTLILCCSPVLSYGINELLQKLTENCFCLFCEFDKNLQEFEKNNHKISDKYSSFSYLSTKELIKLPVLLNQKSYKTECGKFLPAPGTIRRVIRIDFSAGTQFNSSYYDELFQMTTQAVMTFWSNRMTLIKFGRRYCQNFFKNLSLLSRTTPVQSFFNSVSKPLIVFGAGESINKGITEIAQYRDDFFIICADTALKPLLENKIEPDAVFLEETQIIIKKAFIGTRKSKTQIFAGLSAVSGLEKIKNPEKISYFTTEFCDCEFLSKLRKSSFLPPVNNPFGSVGLTAVYFALLFRKSSDIPVYVYGLDFSYSAGHTHGKGAPAHLAKLISQNRLNTIFNFGSSFNQNAVKIQDKDNHQMFTTKTLMNYARLFNQYFEGTKNLFDASDSGITLSIPRKKPVALTKDYRIPQSFRPEQFSETAIKDLRNYLDTEKTALIELKALLSGTTKLDEEERSSRIKEIASRREYLFLHFPDGWQFKTDISFLKRIRTEIDFFLKFL